MSDRILNSPAFVMWRGDMARRGWNLSDIHEESHPNFLTCCAKIQVADNYSVEEDLLIRLGRNNQDLTVYVQREPEDALAERQYLVPEA